MGILSKDDLWRDRTVHYSEGSDDGDALEGSPSPSPDSNDDYSEAGDDVGEEHDEDGEEEEEEDDSSDEGDYNAEEDSEDISDTDIDDEEEVVDEEPDSATIPSKEAETTKTSVVKGSGDAGEKDKAVASGSPPTKKRKHLK